MPTPATPGAPARPDHTPSPDDRVRARVTPGLVVAALGVGVLGDLAIDAGIGGLAGALGGAGTALVLLRSGLVTSRQGRVLVALGTVFAVCLALRSSLWLVPLNLLAGVALLGAGAVVARRGSVWQMDPATATGRVAAGAGQVVAGPAVLLELGTDVHPGALQRWLPALRGLLLAAPVLLVLGGLLASADVVFADLFDLDVSGAAISAHLWGVLVATWLVLGLLRVAASDGTDPRERTGRRGGAIEATVVLAAVVVLFGAFVATQLVAASGGADHVLETAGLTRAEYARSGFFQLLWVAALTVAGLVVASYVVDLEGRAGRRLRTLAAAVVALAVAIVVVAVVRLDLYRDAYGWTMLRLYSTAFAGWLGVVLALLGVALAGPRRLRSLAWFPAASAAAGLALLLALNVANPAAMVARHNLTAEAEVPLDAGYLDELGDDALPTVGGLLDELPEEDELLVRDALGCPPDGGDGDDGRGWAGWNLARSRAAAARDGLCQA